MSKSSWEELPDWTDAEAYPFLKKAPLHTWLWEGLRRNSAYRKDWEMWQLVKADGEEECLYEYFPPRLDGETVLQWRKRVAANGDHYHREPLEQSLCLKWNLIELRCPFQPVGDNPIFCEGDGCTRVYKLDDLSSEQENDFTFALLVDVREAWSTLEVQIKELYETKRFFLEEVGKLPAGTGAWVKPALWLRHIRALDAVRSSPKGTYREIGIKLGNSGPNQLNSPDREGGKIVASARKFQSETVIKLSSLPNTPLSNFPKF